MTPNLPPHVQNFFYNLDEVTRLSEIHRGIAGTTPGRKSKVEVLNKSAIVLLTACWEYYIEDLLRNSFDYILTHAQEHSAFPTSVLARASKELKNDRDDRRVWDLAGNGWKAVLKKYQNTTLEKEIDHFHVPRPENIDALFQKLLGIHNVTRNWYWQKMNNEDAMATLNRFINLRGEIAHNVKTQASVRKKDVDDYRKFLNRTALILHNRVSSHIQELLGNSPWRQYRYGAVH